MADIVKELRATTPKDSGYAETAVRAASEIERLRAMRDSLVSEIEAIIGDINTAMQAPDPKPHLNLILNAHRI